MYFACNLHWLNFRGCRSQGTAGTLTCDGHIIFVWRLSFNAWLEIQVVSWRRRGRWIAGIYHCSFQNSSQQQLTLKRIDLKNVQKEMFQERI